MSFPVCCVIRFHAQFCQPQPYQNIPCSASYRGTNSCILNKHLPFFRFMFFLRVFFLFNFYSFASVCCSVFSFSNICEWDVSKCAAPALRAICRRVSVLLDVVALPIPLPSRIGSLRGVVLLSIMFSSLVARLVCLQMHIFQLWTGLSGQAFLLCVHNLVVATDSWFQRRSGVVRAFVFDLPQQYFPFLPR